MGCTASVDGIKETTQQPNGKHLTKNGKADGDAPNNTASAIPSAELHGTNLHHQNGLVSHKDDILKDTLHAKTEKLHKLSVTDLELTGEYEDTVDSSLKPVTHKEYPTQDTIDFVYKNSLNSSPSKPDETTSYFSGGNFLKPGRNRGSDRRPSGVPPPARALKPGDYLYHKTLNTRRPSIMIEGAE